jgi:hypothetical protein
MDCAFDRMGCSCGRQRKAGYEKRDKDRCTHVLAFRLGVIDSKTAKSMQGSRTI